MAEIRFPLRGRHARRSAESAPEAEAASESEPAADPLAEMAARIRELDAAAESAAARIDAAAESLRAGQLAEGSATRTDLLAGLGAALVERTEEIRADCARLTALMERTANLIAQRDAAEPAGEAGREAGPAPDPPVAEPSTPELATELGALLPEPYPDLDPDPQGDPEPAVEAEAEPPPPVPDPLPADPETGHLPGTSEGVRLIATQMAIAGSSRPEIERRLRIQFGVRDADHALDEIFGTRRSGVR
jgi:hypothetical protein